MLKFIATAIAAISSLGKDGDDTSKPNVHIIEQEKNVEVANPVDDILPASLYNFAKTISDEVHVTNKHEWYVENLSSNEENHDSDDLNQTALVPIQVTPFFNALGTASSNLAESAKKSIDNERREKLEIMRDKDEAHIERKQVMNDVLGKIGNVASKTRDGLLAILTPFLPSGFLFSTAFILDKINDVLPKGTTLSDITNTFEHIQTTVARVAVSFGKLPGGFSRVSTGGTIRGLFPSTPLAIQNTMNLTSKISLANSRFAKYMPFLNRANSFFLMLSGSTDTMMARLAKWTSGLGSWFASRLRSVAKKFVKWILIVEAFRAMINALQMKILGSITEEEWHERNREQINNIIRIFGAPFLVTALFAAAGTVVPVLGNLGGGAAGLITGIILGDDVFRILKIETLISGIYNWFFLGDMSKLKSYIPQLIKELGVRIPILIAESVKDAAVNTVTNISDIITGNREIRTVDQEYVLDKYGQTSNSTLIHKASEGIGTDESAILYAFRNVKTVNDYNAIKSSFESSVLPDYNRNRLFGKIDTMEDYLKSELSSRQYEQLQSRIQTQITNNTLSGSDISNPLSTADVSYSSIETIDRKYNGLSKVAMMRDIVGDGLFNIKESESDLYAVVKNMTSGEYETIRTEYKKLYDKDLTESIRESFGENVSNNVFTILRHNETVNRESITNNALSSSANPLSTADVTYSSIETVNRESITNSAEIVNPTIVRNDAQLSIQNQRITPTKKERPIIIMNTGQNRVSQYVRQPRSGSEGESDIVSAGPSRSTTDSFIQYGFVT